MEDDFKQPLMECPECGGPVLLCKDKGIEVNIPQASLHVIKTDCYECTQCGERIFDEEHGLDFARKIDLIVAETNK